MARNWDYARLAKAAKKHGGPNAFIRNIKANSYAKGRKKQFIIDGVIGGMIATIMAVLFGISKEDGSNANS